MKYFCSYAREDGEFVFELANELRAKGADLWIDQLDIKGGERWDEAVEVSLKNCKGMLLVLSPEAVNSKNVMDEVSYALEEDKVVIPILHKPCETPFRLRRVQHVDFAIGYSSAVEAILEAMSITQESDSKQHEFNNQHTTTSRKTDTHKLVPNPAPRKIGRTASGLIGIVIGTLHALSFLIEETITIGDLIDTSVLFVSIGSFCLLGIASRWYLPNLGWLVFFSLLPGISIGLAAGDNDWILLGWAFLPIGMLIFYYTGLAIKHIASFFKK